MGTTTYCQMTSVQAPTFGARLARWYGAWRQRARDRVALAQITDRDLHDRGFSRTDLEYELNRPFWHD